MSNVLQFKRKKVEAQQQSDNDSVIDELRDLEDRGELRGIICFTATPEGTHMDITGAYADRQQHAVFSLIKGLNEVAERIAASGEYGHSRAAGMVRALFPRRARALPRRLVETTGFGDLGR